MPSSNAQSRGRLYIWRRVWIGNKIMLWWKPVRINFEPIYSLSFSFIQKTWNNAFLIKKKFFWNRNTPFVFGSWNVFDICTEFMQLQNEKDVMSLRILAVGFIKCHFNEYDIRIYETWSSLHPHLHIHIHIHIIFMAHSCFHLPSFPIIHACIKDYHFMSDDVIVSCVSMLLA